MNGLIKKIAVSIFSAALVFTCVADENDFNDNGGRFNQREGRQNRGNRNRNREGGRGGRNWGRQGGRQGGFGNFDRNAMMQMGQWMQVSQRVLAFEAIREKFPQETAELDKAALATEAKYAELAKKAEIEVPASLESNLLKLRAADSAAYTAAIKAIKENPRQNFTKLAELAKKHNIELFPARRTPMREGRNVEAPNKSRDVKRPDFRKLRKDFPEEMKQYAELRNSDPAKARALLQDLIKRSQGNNDKNENKSEAENKK